MSIETVRELEEWAFHAWPAAEVEALDGWRLRFTGGVTRRANSVWPNASAGRRPLEEKLARVERFYVDRGLPARYYLCPAALPADLDRILADRGYALDAPTCVQVAPAEAVIERAPLLSGTSVSLSDDLDDDWFSVYRAVQGGSPHDLEVRRAILQRIQSRTGYALLRREGEPIAIGLGVLERGWAGIFCMATLPEVRRQGAASAVLRSLAAWGREQGAGRMYLEVMEENQAAVNVYGRAGFETLYRYHYRETKL